MVKSFSCPGGRTAHPQTSPDFCRAVHSFSVPNQKLLPLSSSSYGGGGVNGFFGGTVSGQEAGGLKRCRREFSWPVTVKPINKINKTGRRTVMSTPPSLKLEVSSSPGNRLSHEFMKTTPKTRCTARPDQPDLNLDVNGAGRLPKVVHSSCDFLRQGRVRLKVIRFAQKPLTAVSGSLIPPYSLQTQIF